MSQGYINNILRSVLFPIVIFGPYYYATNKVTEEVNRQKEESDKKFRIIDELAEQHTKQLAIRYEQNLKRLS
jgi:hypothetical protein